MEATISIINYNYGIFLSDAIESALKQDTDINFEVLLIDDGSTDNSDEIAKQYTHHPNFRISKSANQGFAKSLSRAINEAKGNFIFLLDADDYFSKHKLNKMMPFLKDGFLYVSDTSQYIDQNGKQINSGAFGSTSTVAVNKEAVLPLLPIENEIYLYSIFIMGRGKVLPESYTYYRIHGNNMTNRKTPGKWQRYLANVTHNLADKLLEISHKNDQNSWGVSQTSIIKASFYFKSRAYYNEVEEYLELHKWSEAKKSYKYMMQSSLKYKKAVTFFHFKMLLKVLFKKPSFPKKDVQNNVN